MTSRKVFQKNYSKTLQTMKKATILGAIAGDVIGSVYEFCATKVRIKSDKQKNVAKLLADRRFRKMA